MSFKFKRCSIPDIILIEPEVFADDRGYFFEAYKASLYKQSGIDKQFAQVNQSRSQKGVLRGLHYQLNPSAQGKLIQVIEGEIFDVAVDIRKGSPNHGKWEGGILNSKNKKSLYIPEGFAHGFCVLSDVAEIVYYCTQEYAPEYDRGVIWNDPELAIEWPVKDLILSKKDAKLPLLKETVNNFTYKK